MPGKRFFQKQSGGQGPGASASVAPDRAMAEGGTEGPLADPGPAPENPFLLMVPSPAGGRGRWRLGRIARKRQAAMPAQAVQAGAAARAVASPGPGVSDGPNLEAAEGGRRPPWPASHGGALPVPARDDGAVPAGHDMELEGGAAADVPFSQPDPGPFGWFLYTLLYLFTAVYSAQPNPEAGLFGADVAGGPRMAVWLTVLPALVAGIYAGVTASGRSWWYPATLVLVPMAAERLALYLYGMAGQWMAGDFPAGWRQALALEPALAFTRETLAPYATPAYFVSAPVSLLLALAGYGFALVAFRRFRFRARRD